MKIFKNTIQDNYVTNSNIWVVDETFFSSQFSLFLVTNLKTRAILGFGFKVNKTNQTNNAELHSDDIFELYQELTNEFAMPLKIHFDQKPSYQSQKIIEWSNQNNIELSITNGPNENQVAESVNSAIKKYFFYSVLKSTTNAFKQWRKTWPNEVKNISFEKKYKKTSLFHFLLNSDFFKNKLDVFLHIKEAIYIYNSKTNTKLLKSEFSRIEEETFNKKVFTQHPQSSLSTSSLAPAIIQTNHQAFRTVHQIQNIIQNKQLSSQIKQKLQDKFIVVQEPISIQDFLYELKEQATPEQKTILEAIFVTYSDQTQKQNELLKRIQFLQAEQDAAKDLIEELTEYKRKIENEQNQKNLQRLKRLNRKKKPKTQPFLKEYIPFLMNTINSSNHNLIIKTRLRIACICLILTGVRISELQSITLSQILLLLFKKFVPIDRVKRGRSSHKAYISKKGHQLLQEYQKDIFRIIEFFEIQESITEKTNFLSSPYIDHFLFSPVAQKGSKPINLSYFTTVLNNLLKNIPELNNKGIKLTTHSFRHGFITELWKKTGDIEFVRANIGHAQIGTTANYIHQIPDYEMRERLEQLEQLD